MRAHSHVEWFLILYFLIRNCVGDEVRNVTFIFSGDMGFEKGMFRSLSLQNDAQKRFQKPVLVCRLGANEKFIFRSTQTWRQIKIETNVK